MTIKKRSLLVRVLEQARPYWLLLGLTVLLDVLAVPMMLLKPLGLKILIDSGFNHMPLPGFIAGFFPGNTVDFSTVVWLSIALVLGVALLENCYMVANWLLNTFIGEKLVLRFRSALFNHVQRLSITRHDNLGITDALYRIQYDATGIRTLLLNNISQLVISLVTLVAMLVVMFSINAVFSLVLLGLILVVALLMRRSAARLKRQWEILKTGESSAMSIMNEVLGAIRIIKSFGKESIEAKRFTDRANEVVGGQMRVARSSTGFYFAAGMLFATVTAIFMYVGAHEIQDGRMTLGDLTLILAYVAQIYGPVEKITRNITEIQSSLTSIKRAYALFDEPQEFNTAMPHIPCPAIKGRFSLQNVSFAYDPEKTVLSGVNLELQPGDRLGIIGSTGSGKSSLLSLLLRFHNPSSGSIQLDGTDIRTIELSSYRNQFAIVLQEPLLLSATIAQNIAYGRPEASQEEIIAAAKNANAHDFIMNLPAGYHTQVGERGAKLSGGEKQRIAIARAFIKNAPVLLLDEPTSSLDMHTEQLVIEAIGRLVEGRNTFLVTHRLDTLRLCNIVLHLEKGTIVDIIRNPDPAYLEGKKTLYAQSL
ncbi:ABC transporter ATP-binding protein [Niabella sp.]|uniref:ABC transporter ATP-binding protein n=1 Tax=Niabella sp. TaxID=1962976 RepID=UPI0026276E17|nr:ABC transporter ATP-binding protein [Niabella sp.]